MNLNPSYTAIVDAYAQYLKTLGFSESTVYNYPKMIYYFFEYLENKGVYPVTHLTRAHIDDYFIHLQTRQSMRRNKALSTAHLNKNFHAVDKLLEYLNQMECPNVPSPTNYRILETKEQIEAKVKALTQEEIQTVYRSVPKLFRGLPFKESEPRHALATLILDLCYGCGLRRSETYALLIEDIDFDKKILLVRQGKGYKDRYVPLSEKVAGRIKVFIYQHRKAFNVQHNRVIPLCAESMAYYIKQLNKESQLDKPFRLHTLRHSIATHLLQNGMVIEQIARFLGHSTLDSTQVYTHLINGDEQ